MVLFTKTSTPKNSPKKKTSQGNGLRKRGSFKQQNGKAYRGQGKN
jgi:hypothetical protein